MTNLLGDVRTAKELGKSGTNKYIWHACIDCGKERWVRLRWGEPEWQRCRSCFQLGDKNPQWKGGQFKDKQGYIMVRCPNHPYFSRYKGYVNRSRLVLEAKLGRYLLPGCEPHHLNEIKDDDRPENLEELPDGEHQSLHNKKDGRAEYARKFRHPQ